MATPLKSILSTPNIIISPVAKALFSPAKNTGNFAKEAFLTPCHRAKACVENTNFTKQLDNNVFGDSSIKKHGVEIRINNENVETSTTKSNSADAFLFNTPNKLDLLKNGLNNLNEINILGKGSFGTVIKGKYKVKIFKCCDTFENQGAKNVQSLTHKNVVQILNIVLDQGQKYGLIFMEYHQDSVNLQAFLDNPKVEYNRKILIDFCKDITSGINYCHEHNVLHLDIKPKNILVCGRICKICDFGNSIKASAAVCENTHYKGTTAYTAPEILRGRRPTTKSDVYSLGILFWQMKFRKLPYPRLENEIIIYKVVKFNFRPVVVDPEEDFAKIYMACWHEEPKLRPSTADINLSLSSLKF